MKILSQSDVEIKIIEGGVVITIAIAPNGDLTLEARNDGSERVDFTCYSEADNEEYYCQAVMIPDFEMH